MSLRAVFRCRGFAITHLQGAEEEWQFGGMLRAGWFWAQRFGNIVAAYGMPLIDRTSPDSAPSIILESILTILSSDWAASVAAKAITIDDSATIAVACIRCLSIRSQLNFIFIRGGAPEGA